MNTAVIVNTYTHSVTYITEKILHSLKNIIRLSGLNPDKLASDWQVLERGIKTWLDTKHLEEIYLEVYDPDSDKLIGRWDFEIYYGFNGDGSFWVDSDDIRYHIQKAGVWPSQCEYRVVTHTKLGRPDVVGWSTTTLRSTEGFTKQSIGTTINGSGLRSSTSYWRRA